MLKLAHKNLEVWKKSILLIKSVYQITDSLLLKLYKNRNHDLEHIFRVEQNKNE